MRIEDLKIFADVVRYHSINIAAEKNYMTSQNVSKIIKNMEKELGTVLLQRSTKGSTVTENGEQFYLGVLKVLKEYEESISCLLSPTKCIVNLDNIQKVEVKAFSSEGVSNYAILNAYSIMRKNNADILLNLNVKAGFSLETIKNMIDEISYDLLVLGIQTADATKLMDICHEYVPMYIIHDEMVLITSPRHPLAKRAMISVQELNNLEFVLQQDTYACRELSDVKLNCAMKMNSLNSIITLISKSDNYCTLASKSLLTLYNKQNIDNNLCVVAIEKKINNAFYIMVKKELSDHDVIQAFCREIYNSFEI